jgi:hypothetical protein
VDRSQNIGKVQNYSLAVPKRLSKMRAKQTVRVILGLLKAPQDVVASENDEVK